MKAFAHACGIVDSWRGFGGDQEKVKEARKISKGLTVTEAQFVANELDLDPDALLALAGKVSSDLREVIRRRPELFGRLIRELRDLPDHAVLRIAREVRDGEW